MPELPDITVYIDRLTAIVAGHPVKRVEVLNPFVLRTVEPAFTDLEGRAIRSFQRIGKRIVFCADDELFVVVHLMIAGRLRWRPRPPGKSIGGKLAIAAFHFEHGTLYLTEAGTKKRASIHVVRGTNSLLQFDRGGLEVFETELPAFAIRIRSENHTLKRTLTDPRLFSGIGNSYSDEILHRARLSPLLLTSRISDSEIERLYAATRNVLAEWIERMRAETGDAFPEKVTAFHDGMAVHGRYRLPCPDCNAPVQRIRYADNETNYCARCQTGGKLLADRALSRLLGEDWKRVVGEE